MKRVAWCATLLVAIIVGRCDGLSAQGRRAQIEPDRPQAESTQPPDVPRSPAQVEDRYGWEPWRPILRVGLDYTLRQGQAVREVAVIFGDATIEGHVDENVIVVLGDARLAKTASIDGELIVIGGTVAAAGGAVLHNDLLIVGGTLDAPPEFKAGGQHIVIGHAALGGRLDAIVPWITRGLLWGRPIVPDLPWVWSIVGLFFLVYLALNLVFDNAIRTCAVTLGERPLTAFVTGLLVLLLTGPVCVLLAVSVVGLAVVPFVIGAVLVAAVLGKVATARWIGMRVVRQESPENRLHSLRSFVIGFVVISVAYMVPVLGLLTWTMLGVLGLGSAALGFMSGYRRENPLPARRAAAAPAATVAAASIPQPVASYQAHPSSMSAADSIEFIPPSPPAAAPGVSDLIAYPHAPFLDRLAAFVLDVILVLIAKELLGFPARPGPILLLLLAYHIGFWTWKGTTVGGIICQLRVIRIDGAKLRFVDALVRGLSSIFSLAVLGLGGLWILRDPERQAWHDKIAGTYVVKVPRHHPL